MRAASARLSGDSAASAPEDGCLPCRQADLGGQGMRVVRAAEFGGPEVLVPAKHRSRQPGPGRWWWRSRLHPYYSLTPRSGAVWVVPGSR